MGSTSRHIMPLAINCFRGRHTHSHKHTNKHTYTYWWSAQDQFLQTRHVPACGWHMPGLKTTHTYARTNTHVHTHKQMLKHAQTYTHTLHSYKILGDVQLFWTNNTHLSVCPSVYVCVCFSQLELHCQNRLARFCITPWKSLLYFCLCCGGNSGITTTWMEIKIGL